MRVSVIFLEFFPCVWKSEDLSQKLKAVATQFVDGENIDVALSLKKNHLWV